MATLDAGIAREAAFDLLKVHNQDAFHIEHGETVEQTMRYFARGFDARAACCAHNAGRRTT